MTKFIRPIMSLILIMLIVSCGQQEAAKPDSYLVLYAFNEEGHKLGQMMTVTQTDTLLGREVLSGTLSGQKIVLAESGIGMTNAAMTCQNLINKFNPKGIIFTGIAGGIDSLVHIGDITVCEKWIEHDYGYHGANGFKTNPIKVYQPYAKEVARTESFDVGFDFFKAVQQVNAETLDLGKIGGRTPVLLTGGVGVSGNTFLDNKEKRQSLIDNFNALVVDMESAAVGQVAYVNDIPFIVFRSASDLAGGSGSATADGELEQFFNIAADNSAKVVVEFLKQL